MIYNAPTWANNQAPAINAARLQTLCDAVQADGIEIQTLQQQQANPYTFKGDVTATTDLPSSGNTVNDTYYVTNVGALYTWTGSAWEQSSVSASDYAAELTQINANMAATYSTSATYSVGQYCIYNGQLYRCTTAITTAEAWTSGHWTAVSFGADIYSDVTGLQSDIDALTAYISAVYSASSAYSVGDYCIYNKQFYVCNTAIASGGEAWTSAHWTLTDVGTELSKINTALATKAEIDGLYEDMTVGNAEQIVSTVMVEDQEPYIFRTAGGSGDIGDREYDTVVGGTLAWNQIIPTANKSGLYEYSADTTNYYHSYYSGLSIPVVPGHKVFISVKFTRTISTNDFVTLVFFTENDDIVIPVRPSLNNGDPNGYASVVSVINDGITSIYAIGYNNYNGKHGFNSGDSVAMDDLIFIDLTQMFGSTIADYVYGLEQATPGAGVAWFRKLFPKDYYAYDAGSLQSVQAASHDTVGFNAYDNSTGEAVLLGGKQYQITGAYTALAYTDINGGSETITPDSSGLFTPTNNGTLTVTGGDSTTTCVHLVWDGERNGEYEPYVKRTYPLDDSLTLRGIPKLDTANNLYYDGDTYESDGTVTRRYEQRAYQSGDESLADAITDGTNTVVKLATPTTETADPFQSPQVVDDFGTEEYVDAGVTASTPTRDVAIPVGHDTLYSPNLRAKLEMAPNSPADGDGDYIVRQTSGQNEYALLTSNATISALTTRVPACPTGTDGTFVLKATVSSGSVTYAWVAET